MLLFWTISSALAQAPQLAAKPYMGWSSWSLMRGGVTEAKVLAQADALKANGLDKIGYRYVNVDDGWSDGWGPDGLPHAKEASFPHGIGGLVKELHQRGLLAGIYLNPGIRGQLYQQNPLIPGTHIHIREIADVEHAGSTRNPHNAGDPSKRAFRIDFSKPGAKEYIRAEVKQLADWGIDFLKLDFVGPGGGDVFSDNREELQQWHAAIEESGRAIWLELSNYMSLDQASLWRQTANGWRIENDIECNSCNGPPDVSRKGRFTSWVNVVTRFSDVKPWIGFAGPGGWNDLDTLELGNGDKDGLTPTERQSMFALWAISCAPLYLGSDLTVLDPGDLELIKNERLIAIDQAGVPAHPVDLPMLRSRKDIQLWAARYSDGSVVLAGFNLGVTNVEVDIPLENLNAVIDSQITNGKGVAVDQISGEAVEFAGNNWALQLGSHASRVVRWLPSPEPIVNSAPRSSIALTPPSTATASKPPALATSSLSGRCGSTMARSYGCGLRTRIMSGATTSLE